MKAFHLHITAAGFTPAQLAQRVHDAIQLWVDERHAAKLPVIDGDRCVGYAASPRNADGHAFPQPGATIISFSGRTDTPDHEIERGLKEVARRIVEGIGNPGESWECRYTFRGERWHVWRHTVSPVKAA